MKIVSAVLLVLLLCSSISIVPALADTDVSFRWDANSEPDLAGYRIFRRAAGAQYDYTSPVVDIACGPNDSSCTEGTDLAVPDGIYFWVVRAYDTEGYESIDSNEQTDNLITVPPDTRPDPPQNLIIRERVITE